MSQPGDKSGEVSLPTKEEIAKLPHWAQVAFAARCARRMLPMLAHAWPKVSADHSRAVAKAVSEAEHAASRACAADAGADAAALGAAAAARAAAVVDAADAADAAALAALAAVAPRSAPRAARAAARAAAHDAVSRKAIRVDFDLLALAAAQEAWTDGTPVPPEFFGPLWPNGRPPGWPSDDEPSSEGAELVCTIDVPEGMSDEEVLELVAGLAAKADAVHRAYGGHGLEIEEGNVDIEREVECPVPAGGAS